MLDQNEIDLLINGIQNKDIDPNEVIIIEDNFNIGQDIETHLLYGAKVVRVRKCLSRFKGDGDFKKTVLIYLDDGRVIRSTFEHDVFDTIINEAVGVTIVSTFYTDKIPKYKYLDKAGQEALKKKEGVI